MASGFKWRGDKIIRRMEQAARLGINRTMGDAVVEAKQNHPWVYRTGTAERSIRIATPAKTDAKGVTMGVWGSLAVKYFYWLEVGRLARTPLKGRFVKKATAPKAYPTLIPAAKRTYPNLRAHIRAAWKSLGK